MNIAVVQQSREPKMMDQAGHRETLLGRVVPTAAAFLGEPPVLTGEVRGWIVEKSPPERWRSEEIDHPPWRIDALGIEQERVAEVGFIGGISHQDGLHLA